MAQKCPATAAISGENIIVGNEGAEAWAVSWVSEVVPTASLIGRTAATSSGGGGSTSSSRGESSGFGANTGESGGETGSGGVGDAGGSGIGGADGVTGSEEYGLAGAAVRLRRGRRVPAGTV